MNLNIWIITLQISNQDLGSDFPPFTVHMYPDQQQQQQKNLINTMQYVLHPRDK